MVHDPFPVLAGHKALESKLAELHARPCLPPSLVAVVAAVSRLQLEAHAALRPAPPEGFSQRAASPEAHAGGMPLLPRHQLELDPLPARALAHAVLEAAAKAAPGLAVHVAPLQALLDREDRFAAACSAVLCGEETAFSEWSASHPDAPDLYRFVVQSALFPAIVRNAQAVARLRDPSPVWPHGHCPLCGSPPLMGRLREREGRRAHACSFCGYEYRVPRLDCPFCPGKARERSHYYAAPEEPGYVVDACDVCKKYIKLADFRETDRPYLPMLDDLASLVFDMRARQMGYVRPTLSAWGF